MDMKKLLFLLFLGVASMAKAAAYSNVYIWMRDGSKTVLQLSEKPKMTFSDNEMTVTSKSTVVSFPYSQLKDITYRDANEDAVNSIADGQHTFLFDGQSMTFIAGEEPLKVMVLRIDGIKVRQLSVKPNVKVMVPAHDLPKGNYVVVVNGVTYKIQKP